MPGFFNNDTGLYEDVTWLRDGEWYEDDQGYLYILPAKGAIAEHEGPDNHTMDSLLAMTALYSGGIPEESLATIGVVGIPPVLRRFSPYDGYYHA